MDTDLSSYTSFYLKTAYELVQKYSDTIETSKTNASVDTFSELHRIAHSLKGQSLFMNFTQIGAYAHALELLFARIKDAPGLYSQEIQKQVERSGPLFVKDLSEIEKNGKEIDLGPETSTIAQITSTFSIP